MSVLENSRFNVLPLRGGPETWESWKQEIFSIQSAAFPELMSENQVLLQSHIEWDFACPQARLAMLMHKEKLVGFTGFLPALIRDRYTFDEMEELQLQEYQYNAMQVSTAEVSWTAIEPSEQHKGGWTRLMDWLDETTWAYNRRYMIRTVRIANNYADKVVKRYKGHIIFSRPTESVLGPQMHYRIINPRSRS